MQAYYSQVLEEGFFHADPHPGNMLWADGRIWLLDLGMVGRLDAQTRRQLFLVMLAFAQGDVDLLVDVSLDLSGIADAAEVDLDAYRADIAAVVAEHPRPLAAGDPAGRAAQPADGDLGPPRRAAAPRVRHGRQGALPGRADGLRARAGARPDRGGAAVLPAQHLAARWSAGSTRSRSSSRPSGCATGRPDLRRARDRGRQPARAASSRSGSPRSGSSRRSCAPAARSRSASAPA